MSGEDYSPQKSQSESPVLLSMVTHAQRCDLSSLSASVLGEDCRELIKLGLSSRVLNSSLQKKKEVKREKEKIWRKSGKVKRCSLSAHFFILVLSFRILVWSKQNLQLGVKLYLPWHNYCNLGIKTLKLVHKYDN